MGRVTSLSTTLDELDRELEMIGGAVCILQVDTTSSRDIRVDGFLRADAKTNTPAVMLTFEKQIQQGKAWVVVPVAFACDAFETWQDNLRAITLGMESLRRVERYKITAAGQQYRGFTALPSSTVPVLSTTQAAEVLSKRTTVTTSVILARVDDARTAYRAARAKAHPDSGGSASEFNLVEEAGRVLGAHFGGKL